MQHKSVKEFRESRGRKEGRKRMLDRKQSIMKHREGERSKERGCRTENSG